MGRGDEEAAIGCPIDMINLVDGIFDRKKLFGHLGWVGLPVDAPYGDFVVARPPGNLRSDWAECGPTSGDF